jgi:hypothetical protein
VHIGAEIVSKSFPRKVIRLANAFAMVTGLVLLATAMVWGQANVNEGEETAHVYVDGTKGSDSNSGAQSTPFKTLNKAVSVAITNNQKSVGTQVVINPGTYRESLTLTPSQKTSLPITLEAATKGTVTVSGADVWGSWTAYSGNNQIYERSWPYTWGTCTDPAISSYPQQPIVLRREMIFVNGTHLTQVLSLNEMAQGTFYVNQGNQTVYIWPASGTNVASATIEVAVRPQLLSAYNEANVVVRGINFQYASSCRSIQPAVVFERSQNILLDSDSFNWNNGAGMRFDSSTNFTAENSQANHNGEVGWVSYEVKYGAWNSDEGSYNNWRGAQGASYALTTEGADFMLTHNSTFTGMKTLFNQSNGMHLDTDALDVTVDSLLSAENYRTAMQVEASEGPVTIENSQMCSSNLQNSTYNGGVNLVGATDVNLTGNTLYNNQFSQLVLAGSSPGISVKNWETGQVYQIFNDNITADTNVLVGTKNQQLFDDGYLTSDWSKFASTLSSNHNTWWNVYDGSEFTVPVPKGDTVLSFSGWKSLTGQDADSTFAAPTSTNPATLCAVSPDAEDYWFVINSATAIVNPGSKATFIVSVIPLGFSGSVSLGADVSQLPDGGASFSPASITTSGSSTVSVSTTTGTKAGTYPVTLVAKSGAITRTITVSVVVQ